MSPARACGRRCGYDRPTNQLNFIRFMVQPLYEAMSELVPLTAQNASLQSMLDTYLAQAAESVSS